ncbi:teneurin-2-like isoform X2 [Mercenaria mercenaria]|uniref:teneurin-2-like isoform X2 n=1 Tax=Mercenaria mercenaria TaxID=6596 RepID=UPI00234FA054|nr:teneurin-2-like isoform X2 [Mercenaria mercenaria]
MRNKKIPGTVLLIAIFLFSHTGLSRGGEQLRRYLLDGNTHMTGNHGSSCGLHQCIHGSCSYSMHNGIELYHNCTCHHGWTGDNCDISTAAPTTQSPNVHQHHYYEPACNNHGQMTSSGCHCHDSWSGNICQYPPGSGHFDHCHQHCVHGTCVGHHGNNGYYYNCKCDHGWHGSYCTQEYAPHGTIQCHNTYCVHGTCGYLKDQSGHRWNYHCVCHHGWDGKHCDQRLTSVSATTHNVSSPSTPVLSSSISTETTTTQKTTTTQTTNPYSSPAVPLSSCDHTSTLLATAFQTPVANQNAIECSPGSHTSHEAFVLTECSVPQNPSSWQQGVNVMADCGSSDAIPTYTPIAAFDRGFYSSVWSLSGIFLGCTNNGFKIALQTCGQAPHITELQLGGSNTQNPNMFYTIV